MPWSPTSRSDGRTPMCIWSCRPARPCAAAAKAKTERATEWLMLTSGTSGVPKIVGHTLEGLTGAIVADGPVATALRRSGRPSMTSAAMAVFRYFLRAIIGGGSMVLSSPARRSPIMSPRLQARGVTHISGTPSHWRKLLMSGSAAGFSPRYVRLVGRDRRPGRARWPEPGLSGSLDRPCLCVDRGRRRLCRQRWPARAFPPPSSATTAMASK